MTPGSDAFWEDIHMHINRSGNRQVTLGHLFTLEKQWMTLLYFFLPWRLHHHHGPHHLWPWDPAALTPCARNMTTCQRLSTALATHILRIPLLLFAALDSQSEARKHVNPLTGWNITDVRGSYITKPQRVTYTILVFFLWLFCWNYVSLTPASMVPAHGKNHEPHPG